MDREPASSDRSWADHDDEGSARVSMVTVLTVLVVVLVAAAAAFFGLRSVFGCDRTRLDVTPLNRAALTGPATLEARLTSGGDPVRGAWISFFLTRDGPDGSLGVLTGGADTDADGFARLSYRQGIAALSSDRISGYSAEFDAIRRIAGNKNNLCRSKASFMFA